MEALHPSDLLRFAWNTITHFPTILAYESLIALVSCKFHIQSARNHPLLQHVCPPRIHSPPQGIFLLWSLYQLPLHVATCYLWAPTLLCLPISICALHHPHTSISYSLTLGYHFLPLHLLLHIIHHLPTAHTNNRNLVTPAKDSSFTSTTIPPPLDNLNITHSSTRVWGERLDYAKLLP